ncbi:MAG: hypothetical protein FWF82_01700, partial [Oscillospiraceae bacterium]|nr:hypothetical protein [Oscillospiraceae bacterium]
MSVFEFVPVKPRTLPLGVHLPFKVFSKKTVVLDDNNITDEYSLLCENITVSDSLIDRLKRAAFPQNTVYIQRQRLIECMFDNGNFLEFSKEEIEAIRNGDDIWGKKKATVKTATSLVHVSGLAWGETKAPTSVASDEEIQRILNLEKTTKKYEKTKLVTQDLIKTA